MHRLSRKVNKTAVRWLLEASGREKRLLENLQHLTDRTVVIVTHRPAALEICDRVFTFDTHGGLRCD